MAEFFLDIGPGSVNKKFVGPYSIVLEWAEEVDVCVPPNRLFLWAH